MSSYKDLCDQYLEDVLPEFFQELHALLADKKKFCQDLELCPEQSADGQVNNRRRGGGGGKVSGSLLGMMKNGGNGR